MPLITLYAADTTEAGITTMSSIMTNAPSAGFLFNFQTNRVSYRVVDGNEGVARSRSQQESREYVGRWPQTPEDVEAINAGLEA